MQLCMCRPAAEKDHRFLNCEVNHISQTIGVGLWTGFHLALSKCSFKLLAVLKKIMYLTHSELYKL